MSALAWTLVLLATPLPARSDELVVSPLVVQRAVVLLSDSVTAGGIGGGAGAQLQYADRYLLQADVSALWGLGNAFDARLSLGARLELGAWVPAGWIDTGVLWGERLEFLTAAGARPATVLWSLGLRLSALRFAAAGTAVSALEPGIGTDFAGGVRLELELFQVAGRL